MRSGVKQSTHQLVLYAGPLEAQPSARHPQDPGRLFSYLLPIARLVVWAGLDESCT